MRDSNPSNSTRPYVALRTPAKGLLRDRDYMLVWGSGSLLWPCRWMEWVVPALLVLELTDSPFQVALVGVSYWIPMLLLAPFAGVLADRAERWHILVGVHAGATLVTAVMLALVATGVVQPWHVFLVSLALGITYTLEWPTRSAFVHDIVGSQRIVRAMSMQTFSAAAGSVAGPIVGGYLIELVGFRGPYIFLVVTYSLGLGAICLVNGRSRSSRVVVEPVLKGLKTGVQYVWQHKFLLGALGAMIIPNLTGFSVTALFPVVARDHLHVGPGLTGALVSAQGIGMIIGSVLLATAGSIRLPGRLFAITIAFWLLSLVGFSLSDWYGVSFVMLTLLGVGTGAYYTLQMSIMLTAAEPHMRGRVLGLSGICVGTAPLGTLAAGAVANSLGATSAITINAVAGLILLVPVVLLTPLVRRPTGPPRA